MTIVEKINIEGEQFQVRYGTRLLLTSTLYYLAKNMGANMSLFSKASTTPQEQSK